MRWKWRDDDDVADANAKGQEQGAVLQLAESTFEISHRTIIMAATAFNSNPCTISDSPSSYVVNFYPKMISSTGFVILVW